MRLQVTPIRFLVVAVLAAAPLSAQRIKVGRPLEPFALASLAGDSVSLATLRGHPLIVKFWATWCPTCRTELPELAAAATANRAAGLQVLTINGEDPPDRIRRYLADHPAIAGLPVLLDPRAHLETRLGIPAYPATVFVDSSGIVRVAHFGAMSSAEFTAGLRTILPGS